LELSPQGLKDLHQNARVSCPSRDCSFGNGRCQKGSSSKIACPRIIKQRVAVACRQRQKSCGRRSKERRLERRRDPEAGLGPNGQPPRTNFASGQNAGRGIQRRNVRQRFELTVQPRTLNVERAFQNPNLK